MKKTILDFTAILGLVVAVAAGCASDGSVSGGKQSSNTDQSPPSGSYTGDGGKGSSIAILAPKATGISNKESYIPSLVQGEFVSNFSSYSAIDVLDRENLDEQYAELLSGYYEDDAEAGADLGHLIPKDYNMTGNIRISSGRVEIGRSSGLSGSFNIPSWIYYPVTSIGVREFANNQLTQVTIPATLLPLGEMRLPVIRM